MNICRVIPEKHRYAGQNIARRGNTAGYEEPDFAMKSMMSDWFTEYKEADMKFINSYHRPNQG